MTSNDDSPQHEAFSSVKYYQLNDANVESYYDDWRYKTVSLIETKGWSGPLDDPTIAIPTKSEAEATGASEAVKKLFKANREAHNLLAMSCTGIPLGLVRRSQGDVREALRRLDKKYARKSTTHLLGLIKEYNQCKLESTKRDPEAWFLELDRINNKLRNIENGEYVKKDYEIKAHLLGNLVPDGYEDVETKLHGKEEDMTVEEIEEEIANKWQRTFKKTFDDGGKGSKTNVAMTVDGKNGGKGGRTKFGGKFKGRCRKCGKVGHKKADCRSDKEGVCFNCGESGHFANKCPKKSEGDSNAGGTTSGTGMFVGATDWCMECSAPTNPDGNERYLLDSGASTHVVSNGDGLMNPSTSSESVRVGNGATLNATKRGDLNLKCGANVMKLVDVQVVPGFIKNIISLGKLSKGGNKISFEGTKLVIENPQGKRIVVEQEAGSHLYYLDAKAVHGGDVLAITPVPEENAVKKNEKPNQASKKPATVSKNDSKPDAKSSEHVKKTIDINDAHELYGHLNYGVLKPLLELRRYVIYEKGANKKQCEACAYAKAKAKGVSKTSLIKADEKGERLFMDISGPYKMSVIGNKFWVLIVDDKTRKAWVSSLSTRTKQRR
jgi:hypothetical protein